jgi:hypothetical protein
MWNWVWTLEWVFANRPVEGGSSKMLRCYNESGGVQLDECLGYIVISLIVESLDVPFIAHRSMVFRWASYAYIARRMARTAVSAYLCCCAHRRPVVVDDKKQRIKECCCYGYCQIRFATS